MKSKVSPLEELRNERAQLNATCKEQEERLSSNVSYVGNNFGMVLVRTLFSGRLWSGSAQGSEQGNDQSSSAFSNLARIGSNWMPLIWGFAEPFLIKYATNKIKGFFVKKKKKKD